MTKPLAQSQLLRLLYLPTRDLRFKHVLGWPSEAGPWIFSPSTSCQCILEPGGALWIEPLHSVCAHSSLSSFFFRVPVASHCRLVCLSFHLAGIRCRCFLSGAIYATRSHDPPAEPSRAWQTTLARPCSLVL